jgi:hypothetical protein
MMLGSKILSWVVLGALTLGVVAMLSLVMYQQGISANESEAQQAEITALQAGLDEANTRLEAQGEPPVPVPEVEPDGTQPQIIIGEPGPRGFTGASGPQGRTGPPGEIGPRGPLGPRGPAGADGLDGANGTDGVDGEPGTPGADGADGADGAPGADGADGADGAPGRGITKVECRTSPDVPNDGGDWIFTYTDGTTTTVAGPCRAITPTPTPTTTKG